MGYHGHEWVTPPSSPARVTCRPASPQPPLSSSTHTPGSSSIWCHNLHYPFPKIAVLPRAPRAPSPALSPLTTAVGRRRTYTALARPPPCRLHHRHAGEIEFGLAGPTLPGHRRRGAEQMSWMPAPLRATLVARGGTASPAAHLPCTRGQEGRGGAGRGPLMGMSST